METIKLSIRPAEFIKFINSCKSSYVRLSPIERFSVVVLSKLGYGNDLVTMLLQHDRRTIQKWVDRFEEDYGVEDRPRSGRSHALTEEEQGSVVRLSNKHPFMVPRDIKHELELEASMRTVARILDEEGFFARVSRADFQYNEAHLQQRVSFAREHASWSVDDWATVVFADEAWIQLGQNGKLWVRRPVNTAYDPKYMKVVSDPKAKIGIWIAFSADGTLPIHVYEGTMNMERLQGVFQSNLLPAFNQGQSSKVKHLLQDNARYHTGRAISDWYSQHRISLINIPPYSPDLNPSENLINILKHKVEARNPHDMAILSQYVQEEWSSISPSLCKTMSMSMCNRVQAVLDCDGHRTGY
jgi:transposase